jgi:hypothetical protein
MLRLAAHQALTDETARKNLEKHGHPDGPQGAWSFVTLVHQLLGAAENASCRAAGMSVGVALPAFLFEKGRAAPLVLGAIVGALSRAAVRAARNTRAQARAEARRGPVCSPGVGILLPLAAVVCYIMRQSEYTSNNILQRTLYVFFHLTEQKNSLTVRHVPCLHCGTLAGAHGAYASGFCIAS